jgi:hypothetical protein
METRCGVHSVACAISIAAAFSVAAPATAAESTLLTGKAAMGDWTSDAPGLSAAKAIAGRGVAHNLL